MARHYEKEGKLFWAIELWQNAFFEKPTKALEKRLWSQWVLTKDMIRKASDKDYHEALQNFLIMDYAAFWPQIIILAQDPRWAEEMAWVLHGTQSHFYQQASQNHLWSKVAPLFQKGWQAYHGGNGQKAQRYFQQVLNQLPTHGMAQALTQLKGHKKSVLPPSVPFVKLPQGRSDDLYEKAMAFFNQGKYGRALLFFRAIVAHPQLPPFEKKRAQQAVKRLQKYVSIYNRK